MLWIFSIIVTASISFYLGRYHEFNTQEDYRSKYNHVYDQKFRLELEIKRLKNKYMN
ncbi:hypothetical protein [Metaclostridioides mangenotii]|uniref:hypothetical protein n=1 Tax=Metaclostridioides mangenotii TaxID=1540 RepID=UPI0028E48FD1|nr:hypothetical protein [Clostridioides mangenotii]